MKKVALTLLLFAFGCAKSEKAAFPGNAERGQQLIAQYSCNVCHVIPGISGAQGSLGPDLTGVATRPTISNGQVQNTPENLVKFIQSPPSMNPSSNMPSLNLPTSDAQDIASYLHSIQ